MWALRLNFTRTHQHCKEHLHQAILYSPVHGNRYQVIYLPVSKVYTNHMSKSRRFQPYPSTQDARQTQVEYTIGGRKEERGVCERDKRNTLLLFLASFLLVIIGYSKIYSIVPKYEFGPVRFEI